VCSEQVVLEIGCGNGSNILPLIEASRDMEGYRLYGCDFAPKSVELVSQHELVKEAASRVTIFEHDISSDQPLPAELNGAVDSIIITFVLSALQKERMQFAVEKLAKALKPGGCIYFRDYGRYDMAQLRFKPARTIGANYYSRG